MWRSSEKAYQDELHHIEEIAASYGAFAAVRQDGKVITWGDANYGGATWFQVTKQTQTA